MSIFNHKLNFLTNYQITYALTNKQRTRPCPSSKFPNRATMAFADLQGSVHFSCHRSVASELNAMWLNTLGDPYMPTYKWSEVGGRMRFDCHKYSAFDAKHLPLIITKFKKDEEDPLPNYYDHAVLDRTCILTGECMLMDIGCKVRCLCEKSTSRVEIYFIKNDGCFTTVVGYACFYMTFGKGHKTFSPWDPSSVNCAKQLSIEDAILELLELRQHRAAQKIKHAYVLAKMTPAFKFCQYLLLKDIESMCEDTALVHDYSTVKDEGRGLLWMEFFGPKTLTMEV